MTDSVAKQVMLKRFYLRHAVPVTVWLVCVAVVIWLFYGRVHRFEAVGMARGHVRQIAANCTSRIQKIPVELFDSVKAGQPLAVLDTVTDSELADEAKLRAQFAVAGAEAERLSAQLIPTQEKLRQDAADMQMNRQSNWRRFETDVAQAQVRRLELQATLAGERVDLDGLAVQVKMKENLLAEGAIEPLVLEQVKVEHDSLAKQVQEKEQLLKQVQEVLAQAQQRQAEFAARELPLPSEDAALEAIRKEIAVQEETMTGLLKQLKVWQARRSVELTSPIDGVVIPIPGQRNDALQQRPGEEVMRHEGEVVRAGDPILAVAEAKPTEIIVYVNEEQLGYVKEGTPVELVKTRTPPQIAQSEIADVGPTIELMPQRLWRNPNYAQWGRPVLIAIPKGLDLVPGELVGVRGL